MKDPLDNKTVDWCEELNNTGGLNELALFAGAGGGILAGHLLGWRTVCAVERDAYAAQVLAQRQNDGILPPFPIWSDVCSFDGKPWKGIIDVISGGFPCQDISSAGKGAGIDGDRSGLWAEMARIIGEVRPRFVFVENSPMLVSRGLTRVIGDLAKMGYDAHWARLSASNFGAPHIRDRLWIVGHSRSDRWEEGGTITVKMTGISLTQQVNTPQRWPTPVASDWKRNGYPGDLTRKSPTLGAMVQIYPTPKASDGNKRGKVSDHHQNGLAGAVRSGHDGGVLNPNWVEWLMGWPIGWTDLKPLEMDRFQKWQEAHSKF
ncbi:DNA cytosine methyltransferase [Acinetobacter soli]|uniref:DNA cytosine methyltransferase n=1 Tax=Acinetobacter soli TaxID=487316 RepID=UPI001F1933B9|nr:DNA cytosine methyltransferase [Acinetobacter soli]